MNHPEMKPFVGYNGILVVDECTNLPGELFADKVDKFMNWYDEPTPNKFEGITKEEWRSALRICTRVFFQLIPATTLAQQK